MKKERIKSLRKEQTVKEYRKRGIDERIVDFKINISNPLDDMPFNELQKRVLSSLKRQIKRNLKGMSFEEAIEYSKKMSFGSSSIHITKLSDITGEDPVKGMLTDTQHKINIRDLLKSEKSDLTFEEIVVGEIILPDKKGEYENFTAYGIFNTTIPRRYEKRLWRLKNRRMNYVRLMNLEEVLSRIVYYNTMEKFILENQKLYYELSVNGEKEIKKENIMKRGEDYLLVMLPEFLVQTNSVAMKVDKDMSVYSSHARTFETKKHINKETLHAMRNNHFLKRYGYVEIDNDVDLKKFNRLSEEFSKLKEKIYIPKAEDHSFRIKRIGHHRANGIYFPIPKATVISVNDPSSYIHELGHQIDYTLGDKKTPLSETLGFRPVLEEYRKLVREAVEELPTDDPFYKRWTGNSKSNASYYMQPTEIFARSYELYIKELGIETSFAKEKFVQEEIYPQDDSFLKLIKDYFDNLFSFFKPTKQNVERSEKGEQVADVNSYVEDLEEFTGSEQLSFFLKECF